MTLTDWPATVNVPVRCDVVGLAPAVKATVPFPLPLAPLVIEIHATEDEADQPQPVGAVTENVLDPPDDPIDRLAGVTLKVQENPDWVTLTDCPAMLSEPLRCDVDEFEPTENVTVPFPLPPAPLVIEIHDVGDVADQAQPTGAVTANVLEPPEDAIERLVGLTL